MALQKQVLRVPLTGLATQDDPKSSAAGRLDLLENTQSVRTTEGGIEIEKRPGTPSGSRNIQGGGSVAAGKKLAALGGQLVMTDGHRLYAKNDALGTWSEKGKVCDLSAQLEHIVSGGIDAIETDVAYADGYACFVVSRNTGGTATNVEWYVREVTTGEMVGSGSIASSYMARVQAIASAFFVFVWDGTATLTCYKIATATPTTISSGVSVATDLGAGNYDVIADVTNTKLWVTYQHDATGPGTGVALKPWTTGNASGGATTVFTARNPNKCIGFLDHTFANATGYVAIGTSSAGVRVLEFDTATWTLTNDTQVNTSNFAEMVTGYFSTVRNVFFSTVGGSRWDSKTFGWSNGTSYDAMLSVVLRGRPFLMDGKRYMLVFFHEFAAPLSAHQRSLYLLEMEVDATAASQLSVAGYLLGGNAGAIARFMRGTPGGVAVVSASQALVAVSTLDQPGPIGGSGSGEYRFGLVSVDLKWGGELTGAPVAFNGSLYLPAAASKVFDGTSVHEHGFLTWPPPPSLSESAGGSLDTTSTYKYALTYARVYPSGRIERSGVSLVASFTLTGTNRTIAVVCPHLCVTESDPAKNANPLVPKVRVEVWRTAGNGSLFTLRHVAINDATTASFTLNDSVADETIDPDEGLYTDTGAVDRVSPPAVLAFAPHRDRMFAVTGDGSVWLSNDAAEGDVVSFSDADGFRIPFDSSDGALVGAVSDGTTLFVAKRSRIYLVQGPGPDFTGNGPYEYPAPLPAEVGFIGPRAFVSTPDGILFKSAKGVHLLDRAGGVQPIPGSDTYDSLTVTGGVTLDDRPMALLTTSDGRTLCWDWQLKVWHTWTGQSFVASCRWQNKFAGLESNGKVHVETPGLYADDGGSYTWKVRTAWIHPFGPSGRGKLFGLRVLGEFKHTATLAVTVSIEIYGTQVDETLNFSGTTATKFPVAVRPAQARMEAVKVTLSETSSDGQGFAASELQLELGAKPGAGKQPSGQWAG